VPVIAKSDSFSIEERVAFKKRVQEELEFHAIRYYPFTDMEEGDDEPLANEEEDAVITKTSFKDVRVCKLSTFIRI
jgi:septin family protein